MVAPDTPREAALIAQRIKDIGIPKREVARRAGVSEGTIRRVTSDRDDIDRPPSTVAAVAAVLGISPRELAETGREDAAGALATRLRQTASEPDVAAAFGHADPDGDVAMAGLMGEVLAGLAMIDAADLPARVKRDLRAEFLGGLTRDAAAWQRQLAALRRAAQSLHNRHS